MTLRFVRRAAASMLCGISFATPAEVFGQGKDAVAPTRTGTIREFANFPSRLVEPRTIAVWLPPDYARSKDRYPVVYVHDGQNAFDPGTSYGGVDWGIDEAMTQLIAEKRVRPAIVVAIWNTAQRFREYMPGKAVVGMTAVSTGIADYPPQPMPMLSDAYLRFITTELKPYIDRTYRTRVDRSNTFTMGSSMGGLISLYAVSNLPGLFGGAACLSTHWPAGDGAVVEYFRQTIPKRGNHRLYFDHGTVALDSLYAPYQQRVDAIVRGAEYREGRDFVTKVFEGADHSERSWRARVSEPLAFLLRP